MNRRQMRGITRRLNEIVIHLLNTEVKSKKYRILLQNEIQQMDKLFEKKKLEELKHGKR